jgi:hypothetical protein
MLRYTPFPPPMASLNLPDARTSCFRYRSGCLIPVFRSYCWLQQPLMWLVAAARATGGGNGVLR